VYLADQAFKQEVSRIEALDLASGYVLTCLGIVRVMSETLSVGVVSNLSRICARGGCSLVRSCASSNWHETRVEYLIDSEPRPV